jgi:hypothetical protein
MIPASRSESLRTRSHSYADTEDFPTRCSPGKSATRASTQRHTRHTS